jgi:hypothetical protein
VPGLSRSGTDDPRLDQRTLAEQQHLNKAEEAVALGRVHIASQIRILDALRKDGHPTLVAEQLLATFQQSQLLHEEHRDRLRKELGLA